MPQSTISLVVHDRTFVSDRHAAGATPELNQARRFALGQAMRTHGPLARNRTATARSKATDCVSGQRPIRSNSLGQSD